MEGQPRIALVDDDEIFQFTASRTIILTKLTDKISQFKNGEEAIRYMKKNAKSTEALPDVIFLDINMPVSDGWMFLEEFAKVKNQLVKEAAIYMVSSSIDPSDVNRAKNNKLVTDYLMKPLDKDVLIKIIQDKLAN